MYYPKNQIQTGFYSNGELIQAQSLQPYTGPYFKTSDNKIYSGNEPNDGKNFLLIFPSPDILPPLQSTSPGITIEDFRFKPENLSYSVISGKSRSITPYIPTYYYPILTEGDIENGEFTRYCVKKANQNIYTEVDSASFSASVSSTLYLGFKFTWVISGEKQQVQSTNQNQIQFVENRLGIEGLGAYLKHNYLQFYQG